MHVRDVSVFIKFTHGAYWNKKIISFYCAERQSFRSDQVHTVYIIKQPYFNIART